MRSFARASLACAALALLLLALSPAPSSAQASGGSFGGSYSSSGGGSSGASVSSSSYSSSSYGGGYGGEVPTWAYVAFTLTAFGIIGVFYLTTWVLPQRRRRRTSERRRLSLALDWHARPAIQEELVRLARRPLVGNRALEEALRAVAKALRAHRTSWLFAHDVRHRLDDEAPPELEALLADLRARYRHEVVRGGEERAGSGATPGREEGPGVVVVSLVLETRERLLAPPASEPNEDAIDAVLAELEEEPRRGLRRFEIVWSPAEEGDRMSTAELERVYGELEPLPAGASLGRHRCAHCRAPYAAELGACPACGAPR